MAVTDSPVVEERIESVVLMDNVQVAKEVHPNCQGIQDLLCLRPQTSEDLAVCHVWDKYRVEGMDY